MRCLARRSIMARHDRADDRNAAADPDSASRAALGSVLKSEESQQVNSLTGGLSDTRAPNR
jgi:hypothetical protein